MNFIMHRSIIIAVALVLIGSGCARPAAPPQAAMPVKEPETFVMKGLRFTLPKPEWTIAKWSGSRALILTSVTPHVTTLELDVYDPPQESTLEYAKNADRISSQYVQDVPMSSERLKMLRLSWDCGECWAPDSYLLKYDGKDIEFAWDPWSNEPPPEMEDGPWGPSYNFDDRDIEALMKSAAPL